MFSTTSCLTRFLTWKRSVFFLMKSWTTGLCPRASSLSHLLMTEKTCSLLMRPSISWASAQMRSMMYSKTPLLWCTWEISQRTLYLSERKSRLRSRMRSMPRKLPPSWELTVNGWSPTSVSQSWRLEQSGCPRDPHVPMLLALSLVLLVLFMNVPSVLLSINVTKLSVTRRWKKYNTLAYLTSPGSRSSTTTASNK